MAETIKLPVIGPTKKNYVIAAGAIIVGFVGYAYWNRTRVPGGPADEILAEDIPQDREPPPTVVGSEDFDDANVRAIISTNAEWFSAASDQLISTGGYDAGTVLLTLGKFLARRQLTESEANLVQAAKGAVGEPPQGGPWPIVREMATPPAQGPAPTQSPTSPKPLVGWHGTRLTAPTSLLSLAQKYARYPQLPDSVEGTKRQILARNPFLITQGKNRNSSIIPKGWIIIVPTPERTAA